MYPSKGLSGLNDSNPFNFEDVKEGIIKKLDQNGFVEDRLQNNVSAEHCEYYLRERCWV